MKNRIQSMSDNWSKKLKCLLLGFLFSGFASAQESVVIPALPAIKLDLREKKSYFLSDVVDSRKNKGKILGRIVDKTKSTQLELFQNLENAVFNYWAPSLPNRGQELIPLVARINTLGFSETRVAPGKIKGESTIAIDFFWYRNREIIHLTTYRAKSDYTRPDLKPVHEEFMQKMLSDALVFFDKWMVANNGKNPALVRSVRLVVEDEKLAHKADTVFYDSDRPLVYSDFKAVAKPGRYAAMVFTSISYEGSSRVVNNSVEVLVKLKVYLVKSMSWMHSESKNPTVLKHEQTHFDIAKIAANRFKQKLSKLELTLEDHDSQIQYQFLESYREMHKLQEAYDKETRHGLNADEQKKWELMVSQELNGSSEIRIQ